MEQRPPAIIRKKTVFVLRILTPMKNNYLLDNSSEILTTGPYSLQKSVSAPGHNTSSSLEAMMFLYMVMAYKTLCPIFLC